MSSSWFDDDDWELMMNDDGIYYGQSMNNQPVYKRNWNDHKVVRQVRHIIYACLLSILIVLS